MASEKKTKKTKKPFKKSGNKKPQKKKSQKKKNHLRDFLKEVVGIVAGKQSEEIVELLDVGKHINEFLIAKKLDITINQTRNILYKIADHGLVSSIRKKDKKKGWYTYFWKIEALKALQFLKQKDLNRIHQTENQIKSREENRFYVCNRCNIELKEENALLYDFTCQECGAVFELKDNAKLLRGLKKNLKKYKEKLGLIDEEIEKEKERLDNLREKELEKRKKQRKLKRRRTIAKKKAARKKAAKKNAKKKSGKKTNSKKKSKRKSSRKKSKKTSKKRKAKKKKSSGKKASKKTKSKKKTKKSSSKIKKKSKPKKRKKTKTGKKSKKRK